MRPLFYCWPLFVLGTVTLDTLSVQVSPFALHRQYIEIRTVLGTGRMNQFGAHLRTLLVIYIEVPGLLRLTINGQ